MRILRATEYSYPCPGGKEIHVYELSRRQAHDHDVRLLVRFGTTSIPGVDVERLRLPYPYTRHSVLPFTLAFMKAAARRIQRAQPRPQIIHFHGDFIEAWIGGRIGTRLGIPTVITVHGGLNPRFAPLTRRAFGRVDRVIALGEAVKSQLLQGGVPLERLVIMSSGIPWELLQPHVRRDRPPGARFISVGSLDKIKGHDVAIKAFSIVKRHHPQATMTIIGDGPELKRLTALARDSSGVQFLGRIPRPAVYAELARSDVFVLASRRTAGKAEGVPTAALEAMAVGLPVVATRSSGLEGLVDQHREGFLVEENMPQHLAEAMSSLLEDPGLLQKLGSAAARRVRGRGWEQTVRTIDRVYDLLVSRGQVSKRENR